MTGGLASPPYSCYNSPIFPFGSSSSLQRGNTPPSQCIDPRHLHDSTITESFPPASNDDKIDQHKLGITQPSPPATDGPPSSPVCVSEKLKSISLRYDNDDENTMMDATMAVSLNLPSSQEDDEPSLVGKKPESTSSDDINNEEDIVMDDATMMDATMALLLSPLSSQEDNESLVVKRPESNSSDDINNEEDTLMDDTAIRVPLSSVPPIVTGR